MALPFVVRFRFFFVNADFFFVQKIFSRREKLFFFEHTARFFLHISVCFTHPSERGKKRHFSSLDEERCEVFGAEEIKVSVDGKCRKQFKEVVPKVAAACYLRGKGV